MCEWWEAVLALSRSGVSAGSLFRRRLSLVLHWLLPGVGPGSREGRAVTFLITACQWPFLSLCLSEPPLLCLVPEPGLSTSQIRLIRSWQERWWRCQPVNKSQPSASRQPAAPEEDPSRHKFLLDLSDLLKFFSHFCVLSAPSLVRPWPLGTPGPY